MGGKESAWSREGNVAYCGFGLFGRRSCWGLLLWGLSRALRGGGRSYRVTRNANVWGNDRSRSLGNRGLFSSWTGLLGSWSVPWNEAWAKGEPSEVRW